MVFVVFVVFVAFEGTIWVECRLRRRDVRMARGVGAVEVGMVW